MLGGFERFVFTDGTVDNDDGDRLVDDLFYYSHNHDVWNAHADADQHYHACGWHEARDPNPFFSTSLYQAAYPDVGAAGVDPLLHFDQIGWTEGRVPSLAFDPRQYLAANPTSRRPHVDPLLHYLVVRLAGRARAVRAERADRRQRLRLCLVSRPQSGRGGGATSIRCSISRPSAGSEGRNPNALFDTAGYLATYADVAAAHVNPLEHYNQFGWREGRDPSVGFDTTSYLAAYPDVAAAQRQSADAFLPYGSHEGRSAFADGVWG